MDQQALHKFVFYEVGNDRLKVEPNMGSFRSYLPVKPVFCKISSRILYTASLKNHRQSVKS
jgi:hypothetical protein